MSNYASIKNWDIANGTGIGVSIFFSGCTLHCKGCFNSELWDFDYGKPFTDGTIKEIIDKLSNPHINHLSILGGDGLEPNNIIATYRLVRNVRSQFPDKKIWLWTGRTLEELVSEIIQKTGTLYTTYLCLVLQNIDILVDGRFIEEQKDLTLKWCGSRNQRVIDMQESLKQHKLILYEG